MISARNHSAILRPPNHRLRSSRKVARGRRFALESLESRMVLSNTIVNFPVPAPLGNQFVSQSATVGADSGIWFMVADSKNPSSIPTALERFDTVSHAYTTFPFADTATGNSTDAIGSTALASGPDGNIWFTLPNSRRVGRFDIKTDDFTLFTVPDGEPIAITAGPDQAVWFTDIANNQIGRIDTATGTITEYVVPQPTNLPPGEGVNYGMYGIAAGADGGIWFTEANTGQIGRIDPTTKAITEFDIPGNVISNPVPYAITSAADRNLWFSVGGGIGEVDLTSDTITAYDDPGGIAQGEVNSGNRSIAAGSDGRSGSLASSLFSTPRAAFDLIPKRKRSRPFWPSCRFTQITLKRYSPRGLARSSTNSISGPPAAAAMTLATASAR